MVDITFGGARHTLRPGESVLEGLERATETARPSSCRSGQCQSCLMRCTEGTVPAAAQAGLKDTWKAQGLFLACVCRPEEDLSVTDPDDLGIEVEAEVVEHTPVSTEVVRIRLQPRAPFDHTAGQFANLVRQSDRLARPYSIASLPGEPLEFHIRRIEGGRLSTWLHDEVSEGATIGLRGPSGSCIYAADPDDPLVLAGTSTGLAPLLGVARDALARGHRGSITLHHGAASAQGLYLAEVLRTLEDRGVSVHRHVLRGPAPAGITVGTLEDPLLARDDLARARVWLCGAPTFVAGLRKRLFLAGMPLRHIVSDPFTMASG